MKYCSLVSGILTRHDFDFYYHAERCASDYAQSFTCPLCGEMGFSLPFINESLSHNLDLFHHLQLKHMDAQQATEVICPICAAMTNGEPNLVTADLFSHIANDHHHPQLQTPTTPGIGTNPYSRLSSLNRDADFTSSTSTRASFRRGSIRTPSRRAGLGRGRGTVSQHFVVDTSDGSDPIAELLTQLSTVRRLAARSNNNSSSSNTVNLQALTRQQYERERLRILTRSQHQQQAQPSQQATSSSNNLSFVESDFFDSIFASTLFLDSSSSTNDNPSQTWAQIVTQQQSTFGQQQHQPSVSKTSAAQSDPSLLRKLFDEFPSNSSVTQQNNTIPPCKSDFVHSLLVSSFMCSLNNKDK